MKNAVIATVAAVAGLFLLTRANAGQVAAPAGGVGPGGSPSLNGAPPGLNGVLTAGGGGTGYQSTAGRGVTPLPTTGTSGTAPAPAPAPPGGGYAYVTPEASRVYEAAATGSAPAPAPAPLQQGAYIKEAWANDIATIFQQGGAAALNAAQEQYGIATFNAGQARAIYNLNDADVAYLQGQGILQ